MESGKNKKISRLHDVLLHLRLPFSYFLLPVFIFGLSQSVHISVSGAIIIFIALHFFIYPASNAYNSYMDEDKGSIGALKNPPPVTKDIYNASILLDIAGLLLMLWIHWKMLFLAMVYIGISKAYSWKKIRLKAYPITGWLVVILFQGAYTFLLVSMAVENNMSLNWLTVQKTEGMLLASLLIGAYYPLTQIYQHEEDKKRGDISISLRLGINGTFQFTGIMFVISAVLAYHYFTLYFSLFHYLVFACSILPAIIYFFYWFLITLKNPSNADFDHTMRMTFISSTCLVICFIILFFLNHFRTGFFI